MSSDLLSNILKDAIEEAAADGLAEIVQGGIEVECPSCGHAFTATDRPTPCPSCGQTATLEVEPVRL